MFWKFNYNITHNHRLMHGYHNDYYSFPRAVGLHGAEPISLSHGDNPTPNLVYTGVLSDATSSKRATRGSGCRARPIRTRPGSRVSDPIRRRGHRDQSPATSRLGRRTEAGGRLPGEVVARHRRGPRGHPRFEVGLQYEGHGSDNLNGPNDFIPTYSGPEAVTGTTKLPFTRARRSPWGTYVDDTFRFGARHHQPGCAL